MTIPQDTQQSQEKKPSDKELNFRTLEMRYEKQLLQERQARMDAERQLQEKQNHKEEEPDNDNEPYVDHRKLDKKLAKFGQQYKQETQSEIQKAVQIAQQEARREAWLENNHDFHDVLQNYAEKFMQKAPQLANAILNMPEGFERQKLVYQNIKALGIHEPEVKQQSIQDKVNANQRNPYYQPTSVGSAPYASVGDFSLTGQKQAYDKMQELKNKLRI